MTDRDRMTRLAPGVYDDGAGGLHLDVGELLAAHGYADTPENRHTLEDEVRTIAGAYGIEYAEQVDEANGR
jgi:hypothetical protein